MPDATGNPVRIGRMRKFGPRLGDGDPDIGGDGADLRLFAVE